MEWYAAADSRPAMRLRGEQVRGDGEVVHQRPSVVPVHVVGPEVLERLHDGWGRVRLQ